ncbi:NAD-dependent deacetylase hst3 [Coemansia interrupta]|uniref:NAD-dependent deacetylase hst3 n=1 Tax=Coemansia interrupta TaxID=1126814 RepID=A0A9W8HQD9_9FUNG|nr:NAD-dependent deacetylase hst3 [Coemansia interrupta]
MKRLNVCEISRNTNRPTTRGSTHNGESLELLQELQRAVQACQRCIIITGAGISVSSGIPDFRSPDGLFQQLKQKYPNAVSNGKDLFDATLFTDPGMISVFYNFMGELRNLVSQANCTPTHRFIKELEERGKLLRCYTQNIDSLEKRIGLETSFEKPAEDGIPVKKTACTDIMPDNSTVKHDEVSIEPARQQKGASGRRRQTTLDKTFTRAVQLHGDLDNVICTICHTRYPFTKQLAEEFCEGAPPPCPRCKEIEVIRDLVGKRSVASGVLRPDIVLYNEIHPQSEIIGALSEYDLKRRPDLLIVIGTSLKIPGIKRMVKEMSRCVRDCSAKTKRAGAGKAILINRDEPPKGWEDVFDIYVSGESDHVIELLPALSMESTALEQETASDGSKDSKDSSVMSIESICNPSIPNLEDEASHSSARQVVSPALKTAKATIPRRKPGSRKKDTPLKSLLDTTGRKTASGLTKKPTISKQQQQQQQKSRKLTSMLKVVKTAGVSDTKRSRLPRAPPQSPPIQVAIPTSPLVSSASLT